MVQTENIDSEKYKLLYEYQKSQFEIAKNHYSKLEDKASKYLTFLGIFITAYTLIAKFYLFEYKINDPKNWFYYFILFYIVLTFILLCKCAKYLFQCLKVEDVFRPNNSIQMIDYITENNRNVVYLGLSHHFRESIESYLEKNKIKANLLKKSHATISLCSGSLVILIVLIFLSNLITG